LRASFHSDGYAIQRGTISGGHHSRIGPRSSHVRTRSRSLPKHVGRAWTSSATLIGDSVGHGKCVGSGAAVGAGDGSGVTSTVDSIVGVGDSDEVGSIVATAASVAIALGDKGDVEGGGGEVPARLHPAMRSVASSNQPVRREPVEPIVRSNLLAL
jgi:hypothetical protein